MNMITGKLVIASIWFVASQTLPASLAADQSDFNGDYNKAENEAFYPTKNDKPLLEMLNKYTAPDQQLKLHLRLGLIYNQQTGMQDGGKAVFHFSKALEYDLPEKTFLQIMLWRGNSLEGIKKNDEALRDYLRGLITCSYYDLSTGWVEIKSSKVPFYMNSPDPENMQRIRDYNRYRERIDYVRFLLEQRHPLVDAVKRMQSRLSLSDDDLRKIMEELSPDDSRFLKIMEWLKSENKFPIPKR